MPSILFVCTANRFRSPLAELVFRFELEKSDHTGTWSVGSAGTWTKSGLPPMQEAIQSAAVIGLDLTNHKSRLINAKLMKEYTLILVMDTGHKEALSVEFPELMDKIFLLSEAVGKVPYDIPDPYVTGEPPEEIASEVIELIQTGWKQICHLAELYETGKQAQTDHTELS